MEITTEDSESLRDVVDTFLKNSNKEINSNKIQIETSDDENSHDYNRIKKDLHQKNSKTKIKSKKKFVKIEEIENIMNDITDELKISFLERIKNSRSRHINLDETIEESLEECQYEEQVNSMILTFMLNQSRVRPSSTPLNSSKQLSDYEANLVNYSFEWILNNNVDFMDRMLTEYNERIATQIPDRDQNVTTVASMF